MTESDLLFQYKKADRSRLLAYGFTETDGSLRYSFDLTKEQMTGVITVSGNHVEYMVFDKQTGEPYVLLNVPGATGAFLGAVRAACEEKLKDIAEKCFVPDVFHESQTQLLLQYAKSSLDTAAEYLWERYPEYAVLRHAENRKWFAVFMTIERSKLTPSAQGLAEVIDVKAPPEQVAALVDGRRYFPAYHMNKKHWYSIILDGSLDDQTLLGHLNDSFELTK